jgi:ribosomal protein S18 acetylase RimI-like enzyme
MNYSVRRAADRDLPELKRMRLSLQELLLDKDPRVIRMSPEFVAELDRFYADVMAKDENRIYVAVDEADRPVGMVMLRILDIPRFDPRPMGRIDDAWVDKEWRNQGVMKNLVRACAGFLMERAVPLAMLDWANNNPPSGECWQKLGFVPLMTMGFAAPADLCRAEHVRRSEPHPEPGRHA